MNSYTYHNAVGHAIVGFKDNAIVSFLEHSLLDLNLKTENGDTLLHFAVSCRNHSAVTWLLKKCDLNKVNSLQESALHLAVNVSNINLCQLLINAGIDVTLRNKDRLTAYDVAKNNGFQEGKKLLKGPTKKSSARLINYQYHRDQEAIHSDHLEDLKCGALNAAINDIRFIADHHSKDDKLINSAQLVVEVASWLAKDEVNRQAVEHLYAAATALKHSTNRFGFLSKNKMDQQPMDPPKGETNTLK